MAIGNQLTCCILCLANNSCLYFSPDMNVISFLFLFVVSIHVHFLWNALLLLGYVAKFYSSFET